MISCTLHLNILLKELFSHVDGKGERKAANKLVLEENPARESRGILSPVFCAVGEIKTCLWGDGVGETQVKPYASCGPRARSQ